METETGGLPLPTSHIPWKNLGKCRAPHKKKMEALLLLLLLLLLLFLTTLIPSIISLLDKAFYLLCGGGTVRLPTSLNFLVSVSTVLIPGKLLSLGLILAVNLCLWLHFLQKHNSPPKKVAKETPLVTSLPKILQIPCEDRCLGVRRCLWVQTSLLTRYLED